MQYSTEAGRCRVMRRCQGLDGGWEPAKTDQGACSVETTRSVRNSQVTGYTTIFRCENSAGDGCAGENGTEFMRCSSDLECGNSEERTFKVREQTWTYSSTDVCAILPP